MRAKRLWVPLVVGLLAAVLAGPATVTADEPRVTTRSVIIPASAFIAIDDATGYHNEGFYLASKVYGVYHATLVFPVQVVSIRRITLYAVDNVAEGDVCVSLLRWAPATGSLANAGGVCTAGATGTDLQTVFTTSISPRRVSTAVQGAFLMLTLYPTQNLIGVKITYSFGA